MSVASCSVVNEAYQVCANGFIKATIFDFAVNLLFVNRSCLNLHRKQSLMVKSQKSTRFPLVILTILHHLQIMMLVTNLSNSAPPLLQVLLLGIAFFRIFVA